VLSPLIDRNVFTMPGQGVLNQMLERLELTARVLIVTRDAGLRLNRRQPKYVTTEEQQLAWLDKLHDSTQVAADLLGFDARMPMTGIGHTDQSQDLTFSELVQQTLGSGYIPTKNPHKPCLALVSDHYCSTQLGFITPFADAVPLYMVYIGKTGVFTVNALVPWHRAMAPTTNDPLAAEKPDLIGWIIHELGSRVAHNFERFDAENLVAFIGPAANAGLYIDPTSVYANLISPEDIERFTIQRVVPASLTKVGEPNDDGMVKVRELFLQSWVASMLTRQGIDRVFVLPHNTIQDDSYASDRRQPGAASSMVSNAMLTRLCQNA
jgi:hypothetical protein